MVSTHLKKNEKILVKKSIIPQAGMNKTNVWNNHLDFVYHPMKKETHLFKGLYNDNQAMYGVTSNSVSIHLSMCVSYTTYEYFWCGPFRLTVANEDLGGNPPPKKR